jgi:uncharacterized protein YgbK (DUF1537 family)
MRHDAPAVAFQKVSELLRRFSHIPYIYLKTDSALRGNLSAMFAAALEELGGKIMFVPAYPKSGRITIKGEQFVGGERLENSPFALDPLNPAHTSNIAEIINKDYPIPRDGVVIFDCETQERLVEIGGLLHSRNDLRLTAGCAGFAEILCGYIEFEKEPAEFIPDDSPVLFLSGSANKLTFDQLARAGEQGIEVLATAKSADDLVEIPPSLAGTATQFVQRGGRNIAIFGGDTALAVITELGCGCLRPLTEIQPGVPLCVANGLNIVTKSGGLGNLDVVSDIEKYLRGGILK